MASPASRTRCQASIEAAMDCLNFELGRIRIPAETTLFSLLERCLASFVSIYAITDSQSLLKDPSTLERILGSVFDTSARAFVTEKTFHIESGLDDHDKASLFTQAVAGMAIIFNRLSRSGGALSSGLLSRELQLFTESEQRRDVLDKISASSLLSSCYTKNEIVDFLMAAMEDRAVGRHGAYDYLLNDSVACVSDRPLKNMGLPWGFTIMSIN